ncbi:hypothetical protein [Nocardia salmonicida]|uniref:hypothetical protein n=1 Tax=Nocardia salmonicida TaxID=53431 RepID=UPI00378EF8A6
MTTAPISAFPATDPRHYTGEFANYWEDREDLAGFAVAAVLATESVRATLLGHRRRAGDLLASAERGLPTDPVFARGWVSELWALRSALVAGPDPEETAPMWRRGAHLADALIENLYTPDDLVLEWHLHRQRTAPFWRCGVAGQDAREYLLSVQYDPTDRYTLGVLATDRRQKLGAHQRERLIYIGGALGDTLGDPTGRWLVVNTDDTHLRRALHPHRRLTPTERNLLARAADLSDLEDTWVTEFDQLMGRWMRTLIEVGAA